MFSQVMFEITYMNILFFAQKFGCLKLFTIDSYRIVKIIINILRTTEIYNTIGYSLLTIISPTLTATNNYLSYEL